MEFGIDTTIGLEGLATAIGVLGAATGYLLKTFSDWRHDRRADKSRGTKLTVLGILESAFPVGLSEDEILKRYCSKELRSTVRLYGGIAPDDIDLVTLERELKSLQVDFLIDATAKDTFRSRIKDIDSFERRDIKQKSFSELVASRIDKDSVRQVARRILVESKDKYIREDAARVLLELGDEMAIETLGQQLVSEDTERAFQSAQILAKYLQD